MDKNQQLPRGQHSNEADASESTFTQNGVAVNVKKVGLSHKKFQRIAKSLGFINVVAGLSCVVAGSVLIPLGLVQFCIEVRDCRTSLCTSMGHTHHWEGTQTTIVECNPDTPLSDRVTLNLGEGVWCGLWILIGGAVSVLAGVKPHSCCISKLLLAFTIVGSLFSVVLFSLELFQVFYARNDLTVGLMATNAALSFLSMILLIVTSVCSCCSQGCLRLTIRGPGMYSQRYIMDRNGVKLQQIRRGNYPLRVGSPGMLR
ncbi:uncharacterized protein LOC143451403 [Clavelina lepadiformis]|uniref:Uncharacterized protein n=1 Tax=Clavelina lepadiformis TaxID=159417 RepID=A0ABP0GJU0_CLALP